MVILKRCEVISVKVVLQSINNLPLAVSDMTEFSSYFWFEGNDVWLTGMKHQTQHGNVLSRRIVAQ